MTDATTAVPSIQMRDGRVIPQLGYGVFLVEPEATERLVRTAIDTGYRHIDTAMIYRNEEGVGTAIAGCGLDRDELFITTKCWNDDQGFDEARRAFDTSMKLLGLEELDLYLIHWPSPARGKYVDTWRALLELRSDGRARSVGVSNFDIEHLERVADATGEMPPINQVELHPYLQQQELRAFHADHGVLTESWSPLGQGGPVLEEAVIQEIAEVHGRTPAQVVLRWHTQLGNVTIPKSATPSRIAENLDIYGFTLTDADMAQIATLDRGGRIGPEPSLATF